MWFQVKEYIRFLCTSNNQHGIHSPFVYQLITKCFYDKTKYPAYFKWKSIQQAYLISSSTFVMKDLGAGSRVFQNNKRKVSAVAKNAGTTYKRAKLLYRLSNYLNIKNALELGTSLGLGSIALGLNEKLKLTTLEACTNTSQFAKDSAESLNLKNIQFVNADFEAFLKTIPSTKKFDLIFVDGNHQKEATLSYFEALLKHVHNDSILIFDDIHWSKGMKEAWLEMIAHPKVKVSIDTFFWGMLFFRREQVKEDFKIRV
ncbi:O-methyltransferase [Psychroflexus planctonicus]|uniref:O-methyltransferase n=1 Tax=Psychroflexus planctonicus TaxID=1526575 RepID=A0ABQ1SGG5_9FLAO|nr:class I SAM-dependent methyltransferase [Psychroflexus planctonicus]GGE38346.1 O-methyltransferase [Psychroflexus planctonicus]